MTELKCPKCGETEEIYYAFDALEKGHGIKCYKCNYEIGGCESAEEAEFKWKSKNDPKALRSCPFCGSTGIHIYEPTVYEIGNDASVNCENPICGAEVRGRTLKEAIAKWNRRVKE